MRLEPWVTPAFFIVFFVLVNYVLLNLVIAVVLETLELKDDEKRSRQRGEILRRTVSRELSDSGYIDAWETARCWVLLKLRCERWSWTRAREMSERLADRERRRLRLRRRAEMATSNGEAAAMAEAMDLPTEDAAVALAVSGQSVKRPSLLIAGFVENLSKSADRPSPSTFGGGGGGGGISGISGGGGRMTLGGGGGGGGRLTVGGGRFTSAAHPAPIKSWSSSVFDAAPGGGVGRGRRSVAMSVSLSFMITRKVVSRAGDGGGGGSGSGGKKHPSSAAGVAEYDLSLLSNFQTRKLASIVTAAAVAAGVSDGDTDDDAPDGATSDDSDGDGEVGITESSTLTTTLANASDDVNDANTLPSASSSVMNKLSASARRRRNRSRQQRVARVPTNFFIADSEIPSIMPPYVSTFALGLFDDDHPARLVCQDAVSSSWYAAVSYAFVAASLGAVLGTDPVDQVNSWQRHIDNANVAVAVFFILDAALKCVAQGFIFTPRPYLSSPWNCIDAVMLVVDVMVLMRWGRWWRWALNVVFAARPVRILNRNVPMQRLVSALTATLPSVGSVISLGGVIFLGFAVVGCRIFGGRFHSCNDPNVSFEHECVGYFSVPAPVAPGSPVVVLGGGVGGSGAFPLPPEANASSSSSSSTWTMDMARRWERPRYSFDWIGAGMLTLFEVASLDGWLDILHSAMDATEVGRQPRENHSWIACLYFAAFITVVREPTIRLSGGARESHHVRHSIHFSVSPPPLPIDCLPTCSIHGSALSATVFLFCLTSFSCYISRSIFRAPPLYFPGSFFIIRAIIGVFIDEFGYISGAKLLTERQKLWRDMHRMAASMSPVPLATGPPGHSLVARFRRDCHRVLSHPNFNRAVLAGVCANTALLASYHYNDGAEWDAAQSFGDAVFVVAYLGEEV